MTNTTGIAIYWMDRTTTPYAEERSVVIDIEGDVDFEGRNKDGETFEFFLTASQMREVVRSYLQLFASDIDKR